MNIRGNNIEDLRVDNPNIAQIVESIKPKHKTQIIIIVGLKKLTFQKNL